MAVVELAVRTRRMRRVTRRTAADADAARRRLVFVLRRRIDRVAGWEGEKSWRVRRSFGYLTPICACYLFEFSKID